MRDQTFRRSAKAVVWLALLLTLSFLLPAQYEPGGVTPMSCLAGDTQYVNDHVSFTCFTSFWSIGYWGHVELLPLMTDTYPKAGPDYMQRPMKTVHWRWKVLGWVLLPILVAGAYVYRSTLFRLHRLTK